MRTYFLLLVGVFLLADLSEAAGQLTITDPASPESVRQVSVAGDGIVAARLAARDAPQIAVRIQYLLVDEATREAIYAGLPRDSIQTKLTIAEPANAADLKTLSQTTRSSRQFTAPSRVTTSVLDLTQVESIIQQVSQSELSTVSSSAPTLMLLAGKEAEMNDIVQHPLVTDITVEQEILKPQVESFDEGTRLKMLATLPESGIESPALDDMVDLTCQILTSRLLEVRGEKIFGVTEDALTVQMPIHQTTSAIVSQQLASGETLLLDPHVKKTQSVHSETSVPVIGKLPYVGRTFRNTSVAEVNQHMIVLLRPVIQRRKE